MVATPKSLFKLVFFFGSLSHCDSDCDNSVASLFSNVGSMFVLIFLLKYEFGDYV